MTNGILIGYKVLLEPGNITIDINDPDQSSIVVTGLMSETTYTVYLLGYNINGDGMEKSTTFTTSCKLQIVFILLSQVFLFARQLCMAQLTTSIKNGYLESQRIVGCLGAVPYTQLTLPTKRTV